jgi:hypothetical protein
MGVTLGKDFHKVSTIAISVAVFLASLLVLLASIKNLWFLHFIGFAVICNSIATCLVYKLSKSTNVPVGVASGSFYLIYYFIVTFYFNSFWIIQAPIINSSYYIFLAIMSGYKDYGKKENFIQTFLSLTFPFI